MATVRETIDRARGPLNDAGKRRYSDELLTGYALEGLRVMRRNRPDLFIGLLTNPFTLDETDTATLPLEDGYIGNLADFITARAQMHDTEAKAIEKAQTFLAMSVKGLA